MSENLHVGVKTVAHPVHEVDLRDKEVAVAAAGAPLAVEKDANRLGLQRERVRAGGRLRGDTRRRTARAGRGLRAKRRAKSGAKRRAEEHCDHEGAAEEDRHWTGVQLSKEGERGGNHSLLQRRDFSTGARRYRNAATAPRNTYTSGRRTCCRATPLSPSLPNRYVASPIVGRPMRRDEDVAIGE